MRRTLHSHSHGRRRRHGSLFSLVMWLSAETASALLPPAVTRTSGPPRGCAGSPPWSIRRGLSVRPMVASSPEQQQEELQQHEEELQQQILRDVKAMRVAEIRQQLDDRAVDYSDCFDKESLVARLTQAMRDPSSVKTAAAPPPSTSEDSSAPKDAPTAATDEVVDEEQVGRLSIKELRTELAHNNIRWAGLLEKSDLVQAVVKVRQAALTFSVTGKLRPGTVTALSEDEVRQELYQANESSHVPLLLDVFAVWCGPCKLMAGQLDETAAELSQRVRVVKMDSDLNPTLASELQVGGLPTLVLFDAKGQEVDRVEGALMKAQLVEWIESKL